MSINLTRCSDFVKKAGEILERKVHALRFFKLNAKHIITHDTDIGSGIKQSQIFHGVRIGAKCGRHKSIVVRNYLDLKFHEDVRIIRVVSGSH